MTAVTIGGHRRELWRACLRGQEPAESLSTGEREHLVMSLAGAGWSDLRISVHTRETEYTVARIRRRAELLGRLPRSAS